MFGSLRSVPSHQILSDADSIVAKDRRLTLQLLEHLYEIDRRKLYLERGFSSTFDYCTKHLRLSEPSAARRIRTARCVARYPQLYPLLQSGELNLTVISMVSKHIKSGNVDEVINRIKGRSKREAERVIAEYEPKTAVPADRTRRMVVPIARNPIVPAAPAGSAVSVPRPTVPFASTAASMIVTGSTNAAVTAPVTVSRAAVRASLTPSPTAAQKFTVTGDSEKSPRSDDANSVVMKAAEQEAAVLPTTKPDTETPQFERLVRVEFTASEKLMNKLDRVRSLASHRLPGNATLEELIDFMAEYVITREDPIKRQERRESRGAKEDKNETRAASANPRQIPAKVRDEVFVRDNQCTYVGPGGQRCDSTHVLQIDHIQPVARGGASTIDNLRVLCAYHNRLESERLMGKRGPREVIREAMMVYCCQRPRLAL